MKGKCYIKLIQTQKGFDHLTLNERLVYSYLVSRGSAKQAEVSEWLGIGINTVTRCCGKRGSLVVRHKLVRRADGRVFPLEPEKSHEKWFRRFHQDDRGWRKAFKYIKVYMPSQVSPLGLRDHIVLSVLYGMAGSKSVIPRVTPQYIVEVLGIAHRTARSSLEALQDHHLILLEDSPSGSGHTATLGNLDAATLSWFRQAPVRRDAGRISLPRIASMYADGHRPDLKDLAQVEASRRFELLPRDGCESLIERGNTGVGREETNPMTVLPCLDRGLDRAAASSNEVSQDPGSNQRWSRFGADSPEAYPLNEDEMDVTPGDKNDDPAKFEAEFDLILDEAVSASLSFQAAAPTVKASEESETTLDSTTQHSDLWQRIQEGPRDEPEWSSWDDEDSSSLDPARLEDLLDELDELGGADA